MKRHLICLASAATLALATHAIGQDGNQTPLASNFLYNYYTQPGASQVTAGIYPAPYWVPANVGHTNYTYQPLMPHEHMYEHRRNYYQYNAGPEAFYHDQGCGYRYPGVYGLNKTTVVWQNGCSHVGPSPFSWATAQRLAYGVASCKYCLGAGCGAHGCSGGQCAGGNCSGGCGPGGCQ